MAQLSFATSPHHSADYEKIEFANNGFRKRQASENSTSIGPNGKPINSHRFDFTSFDENGDGILSRDEFSKAQTAQAAARNGSATSFIDKTAVNTETSDTDSDSELDNLDRASQ